MMIAFVACILMTGCGGTFYSPQPIISLPDTLQIGQSVLSRDTVEQMEYPVLDEEQRIGLDRQMTLDVPDGTQLIGVRPVKNGITLDAFKVPTGEDPNQFKVYFVTRSGKGAVIDCIDLRDFHTSEHQGPMRFGGNRFYTTDATVTFIDASHFTLHRVMTLTSLYLKDRRLTEMWRVEWDDNYEITADGHINFNGQQETYRTEGLDDPIIEEFKSRDISK